MPRRTYKSKKSEVPAEPIGFELDEVEYTCQELSPLELSQIARLEGEDPSSPSVIAFLAEFFEMILGPEQYKVFRRQNARSPIDEETLLEIVQGIWEDYADRTRPTEESSDSSPGRQSTKAKSTAGASSLVAVPSDRPDLRQALQRAAVSQ